jgi:hypothetical protein
MSLWGNKDKKTMTTTTLPVDTAGTLVGTGGLNTELTVGDFVQLTTKHFVVTGIHGATGATVAIADGSATIGAIGATNAFVVSEKPQSVHYASGESVAEIYGADTGEAGETDITHSGWVKRTVGTGGRSGRTTFETLVATGSISGDAEDTVLPDPS